MALLDSVIKDFSGHAATSYVATCHSIFRGDVINAIWFINATLLNSILVTVTWLDFSNIRHGMTCHNMFDRWHHQCDTNVMWPSKRYIKLEDLDIASLINASDNMEGDLIEQATQLNIIEEYVAWERWNIWKSHAKHSRLSIGKRQSVITYIARLESLKDSMHGRLVHVGAGYKLRWREIKRESYIDRVSDKF